MRELSGSAVQSKAQLLTLLAQHQEQLRAFGVRRCGIFGSFVHDRQDPDSDIDVLVEFMPGQKTFDNFVHLAFYLEELFGRKVDLLTPEGLSPYIGPSIEREVEYVNIGT
jgi:predicted nucleotidyltransferase